MAGIIATPLVGEVVTLHTREGQDPAVRLERGGEIRDHAGSLPLRVAAAP